jgi:hypothetical protein
LQLFVRKMAVPPAAVADLFSTLYRDAAKWENPTPDYETLANSFGATATAVTAPVCRDGLVQLSTRSPIVIAFVSEDECDAIYVAHSLTIFSADVTSTTGMDGLVVGLVGDQPASAIPIVFPQAFFTVIAATHALDVATIQGAAGHGATPPCFALDPMPPGRRTLPPSVPVAPCCSLPNLPLWP